jgi:alpha-tubulin suppressor-like RCC1 family protein
MGVRFLFSLAALTAFIDPQDHPKLRFQSVTAGTTHTCGVTATTAYCWGDNGYGQLGTGNEHPSAVPVAVAGGETFASVSAGDGFTCGVTTSGEGYCWGRSAFTQSQGGRPPRIDTPAPVSGSLHFVQVSAGANHACGVTTDRAVYCWGANALGQLGSGDSVASPAPRPVAARAPFESVSAGWDHTCAVATDGAAYCWGNNRFGQLGDGSQRTSWAPRPVVQVHDFLSVSAGGHHTCGVTARGIGYCWGDNFHSQFGRVAEGTSRLGSWAPVPLQLGHRLVAVSAGGLHTCALTFASIDRVSCWGANGDYQLGVRTFVRPDEVVQSKTAFRGIEFVQIDAGDYHTCGTTEEGVIYCWGRNEDGQLGDGTLRVPVRPARVTEPDSTVD